MYSDLHKRINTYLRDEGITQLVLSELMGVSRQTVSKYIGVNPQIELTTKVVKDIEKALELPRNFFGKTREELSHSDINNGITKLNYQEMDDIMNALADRMDKTRADLKEQVKKIVVRHLISKDFNVKTSNETITCNDRELVFVSGPISFGDGPQNCDYFLDNTDINSIKIFYYSINNLPVIYCIDDHEILGDKRSTLVEIRDSKLFSINNETLEQFRI